MTDYFFPQSEPAATGGNKSSLPLVERLDSSIGELSTMMGGMLTELLRRTLRGSVRQIDEELQAQVAQKVDTTVAQRLPAIEQAAADVADKAARQAATEVAVEEVRAVEQRTRETAEELAARIETAARTAEQQSMQTAEALTGKIELVDKRAEAALTSRSDELAKCIAETASTVTARTEEKAQELARHIEEAERRAKEAAQAELTTRFDDFLQRSKKATTALKDKLQALEAAAGTLSTDVDTRISACRRDLLEALEQKQAQLQRELAEAHERNEELAARVAELEKPRGLRALWARLFGRRKSN